MVRLKDIAARAGVSVMTVSRVMRDASDISDKTKERIRGIARQMGYVPDSVARGLRTRRSHLFGLIVPALGDPTAARVAAGIEERAHELGYDVVVASSKNLIEREEACIRRCLARRVDGLFILPVYRFSPSAAIYDTLREREVRTVIVGQRAAFCDAFANVETDDFHGGYLAAKHLLELGHRRIAFLAGPAVYPPAQARFEGYRQALREANVDWEDRLIFSAGATIEDGARAATQMIRETPGATAIQAVNDWVAVGAFASLLGSGLRVPQDVSVVGHGNIGLAHYLRIPLTTVDQPKYRLGVAAVELMQHLFSGKPRENRRLPLELIIRASTVAPGWRPVTGTPSPPSQSARNEPGRSVAPLDEETDAPDAY